MPPQAGEIGTSPRYLAIGAGLAVFSVSTFAVWSVDDSNASLRQMGLIGAATIAVFLSALVFAVAYRVVAARRSVRIEYTPRGVRSQRTAYGLSVAVGVAAGAVALASNPEQIAIKIGLAAVLIVIGGVAIWLLSPFVFERCP